MIANDRHDLEKGTNPMSSHRRHHVLVTIAAVTVLASACGGGKSASEAMLENLVESQGGGDVDIDFDDNGSFSVRTEDGEVSFDIDDDGSFSIDSEDGSATFDVDGDGNGALTFEGEDGTESIDIQTDEDGNFTMTDGDGQTVLSGGGDGDDGSFSVVGEDGTSTFESGTEIPDQWPDDIPRPDGLTDVTGTYFGENGAVNLIVGGSLAGDGEDYLADYLGALGSAGFEESSSFNNAGVGGGFTAERGDVIVAANVNIMGDLQQFFVSVTIPG